MQWKATTLPLLAALALPSSLCEARPTASKTSAPVPTTAIGISNVVLHLDGDDEIGLASADLRVLLLERLRERGFNAAGAENLVFGKDESHKAAYRLGGTVREIRCLKRDSMLRCYVGIEWLLLEVARDAIVYKAFVRYAGESVGTGEIKKLPALLVRGALDRLIEKDSFRLALAPTKVEEKPGGEYKEASFTRCPALSKKMPRAAESVLNATALLRTSNGLGSGVFISADGLLLTAAHVVNSANLKARLRDGTETDAFVVRRSDALDVALVRVGRSMAGQSCLEIAAALPSVGDELYAAGAPSDERLAFSITKGILSGIRELDGKRKLQTDAAVSPGYSGGPLVNVDGAISAIITSKLVGKTIEGVAFSAPIRDVLAALVITPGATTAPELREGKAPTEQLRAQQELFVEPNDAIPSLDPATEQRLPEPAAQPGASLQGGGAKVPSPGDRRLLNLSVGSLIVGSAFLIGGYSAPDEDRLDSGPSVAKAIGFGGVVVGLVGLLAYSSTRPSTPSSPPRQVTLSLRPGGLGLSGSF